jgi:hypothetical protein
MIYSENIDVASITILLKDEGRFTAVLAQLEIKGEKRDSHYFKKS